MTILNLNTRTLTLLGLLLFLSIHTSNVQAQHIQWSSTLKVNNKSGFLTQDSTEQNLQLFTTRSFLLDSLKMLAPMNPFQEKVYTLEFDIPQQVSQLVIPSPKLSRLMIYLMLQDTEGKNHLVYEYGATPVCEDGQEVFVLNIPPTLYKVQRIEAGILVDQNYLQKVGLANLTDGNQLVKELLLEGYQNICLKSSYLSDKTLLPASVNSPYDEAKPLISPDGKTLIFARQNHPENKGKKRDAQDIYQANFKDGQWSKAENLGEPLNNKASNGAASITPDGNRLLLINKYLSENEIVPGVSISQKTLDGWAFPTSLEIENFYNHSEFVDYFLSNSQQEMLLALEREDTEGDQDLYVSFYQEDKTQWSEPINLGPTINTFLGEASPFLAPDGLSLYFASEGHLGHGGFDIFYSRRLDDTWTRWSEPENLGSVINSFGDDFYYTIPASGDFAYFISSENGSKDIYRVGLPKLFRPEPVVLFAGNVYDAAKAQPAQVRIVFTDALTGKIMGESETDPKTGSYKVVLPTNGAFHYTIYRGDKALKKYSLTTLDQKKYTEIKRHHLIGIDAENSGSKITFSSEKQGAEAQLSILSKMLKAFSALNVRISGRFNEHERQSYDPKRAFDYLLEKGVNEEQTAYLETDSELLALSFDYDEAMAPAYELTAETLGKVEQMAKNRKTNRNTVVLLGGQVFDGNKISPLEADVRYESMSRNGKSGIAQTDPFTGRYQVILPAGDQYILTVQKDGFKNYKTEIDLREVKHFREQDQHLILWAKNEGDHTAVPFTLGHHIHGNLSEKALNKAIKAFYKRNIHKAFSALGQHTDMIPEAIQLDLDHLALFMNLMPESSIQLISYDKKKYSEEISRKRAEICKEYLIAKGIAANRIQIDAKGYDTTYTKFFFWRKRNSRIEAIIQADQPAVKK